MKVSLEELCGVIASILAQPEQQPRVVLASLDRLALSAYVVDEAGNVRELNGSASASSAQLDRLAPDPVFRMALRAATGPPLRSSLLPLAATAEVSHVAIAPIGSGRALVVMGADPEAADVLRAVCRRFLLTDTEARVLRALGTGQKVSEIARAHGVQASTVRAQVRSLFEKTGVHRQSDLVRLALTGDAIVSPCVDRCSRQHVRKSDDAAAASRWQRWL